jgi:hypothetical protein
VSSYFVAKKESETPEILVSTFRGRALRGTTIALPEGCTGATIYNLFSTPCSHSDAFAITNRLNLTV